MTDSAGSSLYRVPRQARRHAANPILRVDGLVETPLTLTPGDLADLPRWPYVGGISCIEAGEVPETDWEGVRLSELVAMADPLPDARFVRVSAGPYAVPVSLEEAHKVLLCDRLSDQALTPERGGPWRLAIPGSLYCTSVKWVDRLEITAEPPDNSAERIAQARARARAARTC